MISPEYGLSRAPSIFNMVDFPDPEGPIMETKLPFSIERLMWLRAVTLPSSYCFKTSFNSINPIIITYSYLNASVGASLDALYAG